MDYQIQVVMLPVADIDRAKDFYEGLGFHVDVDHRASEEFRVVQCTPPGSACSVVFGLGITDAVPGSVRGTHLVVTDIEQAHAELTERGASPSDIRHMTPDGWQPGPDPSRTSYNSFTDFTDPDGNAWIVQEVGHADGKG